MAQSVQLVIKIIDHVQFLSSIEHRRLDKQCRNLSEFCQGCIIDFTVITVCNCSNEMNCTLFIHLVQLKSFSALTHYLSSLNAYNHCVCVCVCVVMFASTSSFKLHPNISITNVMNSTIHVKFSLSALVCPMCLSSVGSRKN